MSEIKETRPAWKKGLRGVAMTVVILAGIVVGFYLLLALIFARSFEQHAILALYPTTFALLIALAAGQWKKRWFKRCAIGWAVLAVGFGIYLGVNYRQLSIPTVDDRTFMLSAYYPFKEDTKAVTLPEESTLSLTFEEASTLRIDGATALFPVYASFARNAFEPSVEYYRLGEDGQTTLDCDGTTQAYSWLIEGERDVIFCAAPSKKQLAAAEEAGLELHLTPIGREAFVFFVNQKNPVTGLTVEEIQRIYTGEITNWKDVGGENRRILAYQRDEGSGSQTAMQQVMNGLTMMTPDKEELVGGMGGIIERVAAYRNHRGALGYTFRFYSNEMVGNDQIRLLALNGVLPTKETIRDGSYPITDCFYAVTASPIGESAPEETNPTLKAFLDWCLSEQGQWIVEAAGYVGVE